MILPQKNLSESCKKTPISLAVAAAIGSYAASPAVHAQEQEAEDHDLEEIVVVGRLMLREKEVDSAMKMTMRGKDIAQSVSVITEDLIQLANISRFDDIYKVDASSGSSFRLDEYPSGFYRGFDTQGKNSIRIDGFRFISNIDVDLAPFERIEVIKGPTSTIYGQNNVGGALNAVLHKPTGERILDIDVEGGSFDYRRIDVDWGGAINDSETITGRLIVAFEDSDSYVDVVEDKDFLVAPMLGFELGDATTLTTTFIYQHSEGLPYFGSGAIALGKGQLGIVNEVLNLDRSFFFSFNNATDESDAALAFIKLDHELSDHWRLRLSAQYVDTDRSSIGGATALFIAETATDLDDPGTFRQELYDNNQQEDLWGVEANLIGDVELFGREHTLFLGLDYAKRDLREIYAFSYLDANGGVSEISGVTTQIPLSELNSGLVQNLVLPAFDDFYYQTDASIENVYAGFTAQLLLRPTDDLTVMLGGRLSYDDNKETYTYLLAGTPPEVGFDGDETNFVGQIGVTYALNDQVNLYANWGQTYEPDTDRVPSLDANGAPDRTGPGVIVDPEEGTQLEIGFKGDFFNDQISMEGAIFDITRDNITQGIRTPGLTGFVELIGEQQSRGAEFRMAGAITRNWKIFLSAAYIDAEYNGGDLDGLRPVNTPEFGFSVFPTYEFLDGPLKDWRASIGYVYKDYGESGATVPEGIGTFGGADNIAVMDFGAIKELNLSIYYESDNWRFWLQGTNLTNEENYLPARRFFTFGFHPTPERSWQVGVGRSFY